MIRVILFLFLIIFASNSIAGVSDKRELIEKLDFRTLSGVFNQITSAENKEIISKNKGSFKLKKPNKFNWLVEYPDIYSVISDSVNIYIYDDFVEELSIHSLDLNMKKNPLFLLMNEENSPMWNDYKIKKIDKNSFKISHKKRKGKKIELSFNNGKLSSFKTFIDGNTSIYTLESVEINKEMKESDFIFIPNKQTNIQDKR